MHPVRAHSWLGNIRELEHAFAAAALSAGPEIDAADLPLVSAADRQGGPDFGALLGMPLTAAKERLAALFERQAVLAALERHGYNVSAAARQLGIHRQSLQQKLAQLGIERRRAPGLASGTCQKTDEPIMQLVDLTWPRVRALSKDTPVVFPVAAIEQHGEHLPLFTDSMLLGEIVRRAGASLGERVLWAPLQWLGNSHHHLEFPGTLSAEPRVYLDLLNGLLENFIQHGFKRLVLINGHGGNDVPGRQAVFEARQRHRGRGDLLLLFATYWSLAGPAPESIGLAQRHMGHACEWETSMILRLAPQLVADHRSVRPVEFGNAFEPAARGWITRERTEPGHIGEPQLASAEKGEALLRHFSDGLAAFLQRVIAWDGRSWSG
jgi:creatinine amidohydrolase